MPKKGRFIVLEGTDGSGKGTQFEILMRRLKSQGADVATFDFPQYEKQSSYFVREYLNGKYGSSEAVGPYRASMFYALDRFDVGEQIRHWLNEGRTVISNRYVSSNMGHQGAKMGHSARKNFFRWLNDLEYGILGIPRPHLTIVLHVPAKTAQALVDKKAARKYIGGAKRDIHEADLNHLKRAEDTYLDMVRTYPREFKLVECMEGSRLMTVDEIHQKIWRLVEPKLKSK